jgi:type III pantothenate kinase
MPFGRDRGAAARRGTRAKQEPGRGAAPVKRRDAEGSRPRAATTTAPGAGPRADRPAKEAAGGLIAVDVGNSETTVGLFRGESLSTYWRLTSGRFTADEVSLTLDAMLRQAGGDAASPGYRPGAVLSSVAPSLTLPWAEALERRSGAPPVEVSPATAPDLVILYHDPASVGADRIANAIAVRALYGTPAIVVDLGTATTFDCISSAGEYLGGVIAPGVMTSAEELFRRAARLPRVELRKPERVLGRATHESIQAGLLWGAAGQVDALVRRLALEMKGTPHVIATGGLATVIAPECETINVVDPTLTLKGMRLIWERAQ